VGLLADVLSLELVDLLADVLSLELVDLRLDHLRARRRFVGVPPQLAMRDLVAQVSVVHFVSNA
jgi:hypothetical protein